MVFFGVENIHVHTRAFTSDFRDCEANDFGGGVRILAIHLKEITTECG